MIEGFKRENFFDVPEGTPDEVVELAFRYAVMHGRLSTDLYFSPKKVNFRWFINHAFWWDRTDEGGLFWLGVYDRRFGASHSMSDISELKNYLDFKKL